MQVMPAPHRLGPHYLRRVETEPKSGQRLPQCPKPSADQYYDQLSLDDIHFVSGTIDSFWSVAGI